MAYRELLLGKGRAPIKKQVALEGREAFANVTTLDIDPAFSPDVLHDLEKTPYPFDDNSFDEIHAYQVLEHISAQGDHLMWFAQWNEFYRILKPGGYFIGSVPRHDSWTQWGDPSHKRIITKELLVMSLDRDVFTTRISGSNMSDFGDLYRGNFHAVYFDEHDRYALNFILKVMK